MQHQPTPLVGVTAIPAIGGAPDGDPRHTIPRPRSAAGALTGLAGIVAAFVATYLLRDWLQPPWLKALVVVAAVAAAMVLVDVGIYRNHRSESSGLAD